MLKNTFIHIPGVSKETERELWSNNIYNWYEFLKNHHNLNIRNKKLIHSHIRKSLDAYQKQDHDFFLDSFPNKEHWRAYHDLKDRCCFLDIETTGLSRHHDEITVIGLYDGEESKIFVQGKNMEQFRDEIKKYPMVITFNGKCFDLPFIRAKMPEVCFDKFHIDLRYAMRELGYVGGLKRIEREIGISRGEELNGMDGWLAVSLWYKYLRGDEEALQLLIRYNIADIENLEKMMDFAFAKLKEKHFFSMIG